MTPRTYYFAPSRERLLASPALNLGGMGVIVHNVLIPHDAAYTQTSIEERIAAVKAKVGDRSWYLGVFPHHEGRSLVSPDDTANRNILIRNLQWVAGTAMLLGCKGLLFDAEPIWPLVGWKFWPTEPGTQALGTEMREAIRANGRGALEIGAYAPWSGSMGVRDLVGFRDWFTGLTNSGMSSSHLFLGEDYVTGQTYKATRAAVEAAFHCTYWPGVGMFPKERKPGQNEYRPVPIPDFRERLAKQLERARRNSLTGRAWLFPYFATDAAEWTIEHPTYTCVARALA